MTALDLKRLSPLMVEFLRTMRLKGDITPTKPWSAQQILDRYHRKYPGQQPKTDREFRKIVSYARETLHEPIWSDDEVYSYCLSEREWDEVEKRLLAHCEAERRAAQGPRLKFELAKRQELPLREHPITEKLKTEFGAIEV